MELLAVMVVLLKEFKVMLRNTPKPTMTIIAMTISAETPRETALFVFVNVSQHEMI